MIRHIYKIVRKSYCMTATELYAAEEFLEINDVLVDSPEKLGVRFQGERTDTYSFLFDVEAADRKELEKELRKIVNDFGVGIKYEYNDEIYLMFAEPKHENVWHEADLIIHQVHPFGKKDTCGAAVLIGKKQNPEEVFPTAFESEYWFNKWYNRLRIYPCAAPSFPSAVYYSFLLTLNEFYYTLYPSYFQPETTYYAYRIDDRGFDNAEQVKDLTLEQFDFYVVPSLKGCAMPDLTGYSSLSPSQLTAAYCHYIMPFWDKFIAK